MTKNSSNNSFDEVFTALRVLILPYRKKLDCQEDSATRFHLDTRHIMKNRKPLFFAAVEVKKNYVSFHLMPVYVEPELLDTVSAALRKRMQGKSCFNFKTQDGKLFEELGRLVQRSYEFYVSRGYVEKLDSN